MYRLIIPAFLLALLTGCAVMDTSVMDTAEPLQQGKIKAETFATTGLILESAVYDKEDEAEGHYRHAAMWPVMGLKFGIGTAEDTEVGGKFWASISTTGAKVYLKSLIDRKDDVYYSVIPALTYTGIDNDDAAYDEDEVPDTDQKYRSVGVELPVLVTKKFSEAVSLTAALRMNYNYFTYQYVEEHGETVKHGPTGIVHGGVLVNSRFRLAFVVLTPEVGVEVVPVVNGDITILPTGGLTLGLQF